MFDTRSKIVSSDVFLSYAEAHPELPVVLGYFDPMWAPHAERLQRLAADGKLLVIVAPLETALLNDRARAELAASFGVVELVTLAADEIFNQQWGPRLKDERLGDEQRYKTLAAHVRKRNNV